MRGRGGVVVAVEERAARIGASVLEQGGNAVDAVLATLLALAVTHPSAASLGGGGFALVRRAGGPTRAFDFRETAPLALTRSDFVHLLAQKARGPRAVGVPGLVAGLFALHANFATRPFAELAAPALELARHGYVLPRYEAALVRASADSLGRDPSAARIFFPHGAPPGPGLRLRQRDLGWTLEQLVEHGVDAFYRGPVSERITRALGAEGPSRADFAAYRCIEREPLRVPYRELTLETMPAPSAGGVALAGTLLLLGARPMPDAPLGRLHRLLEAERRAQAERRFGVSDPDALSEGERRRLERAWRDPHFWAKLPISDEHATSSRELDPARREPELESEHTTHVSVVDKDGFAVSVTVTLSASFGAKLVAAGTGIVMNNALGSFTLKGNNQPIGGRRTTSSMAPSLLLSGEKTLAVLGTPGGDTIPSTLAALVMHLVDEGMPLDRAVDAPRWHQSLFPDEARYEAKPRQDAALLEGLRARGHHLKALRRKIGDANCIVLEAAGAAGYADSREPGVAVVGR